MRAPGQARTPTAPRGNHQNGLPVLRLSPREREIAVLVAQGLPTKAIAAALAISRWTVCTHLRRIYARVGVGSRAAMVARLMENGLL